ncbi:glycogen debranching enzyme GlgX [Solimonas fluminis]|uniref:Glycogen debranching enzyme GlgX n=1 Tax=Solimonas fluminis TaxID=2086571 RepID=A0A2S5TEA7_9GAMM|nr:glycogen debranching protein GlgX [Solimonas fluminis]PPE73178.1 glycogen debranching enzyme GlgX [Solimonas fluminis]
MSELPDRLERCHASPLGAQFDGRGTCFSVFSEHAEKVELCLFDGNGRHETTRLPMPDCTDGVWHGYLPNARPGQLYGYRVSGPYEPRQGHRFNPNKLLLDPYARRLHGQLQWHDALYGYHIGSPRADLSFDRRDSASHMPKGVVWEEHFDWGNDHPPRIPWEETVIYEMHLRGFTMRRGDLPEHDRGSFGALGHPSTVDYLRQLGITAVELLPVHAFARDRYLLERGLTNYWGYNTLSWFAPEPAYLSDGTLGQIKWAVKQLHAAGIEVLLDVVYNHSCEGNELGPTLSLRGFDNAVYYRLMPEDPRYHINDTGCGNTLDFSQSRVIQLAMDSLRYWVQEFHVDGFRFDLGVSLGREPGGFDPGAGFFDALLQDPVLSRVKLISEPWDVGPGGYRIGQHPAGFGEWNGLFRDDLRRYWRGDPNQRAALAARLQGSADLFDHHRRRPWASINFVTAHDGFTLTDLLSYSQKHNEANGEDNRDGADHNDSHNWGSEGDTQDPRVLLRRQRLRRSMLATLFFAHGTPMLLAGDEFGQTQGGNNNAYCQDNEIAWLDWSLLEQEDGRALHDFVMRLIGLRRQYPLLRADYYQHAQGEVVAGLRDVDWFDESGNELAGDDWKNGMARLLAVRRARRREDGGVEAMMLLSNADIAEHRFHLPQPALSWRLVLDTREPSKPEAALNHQHYDVYRRSLVLLLAQFHPQEPAA